MQARFAHTNLIAEDWRSLADFYCLVFGCIPVPPERDFAGAEVETGTGVPGARLRGVHLRLPGGGDTGPTLEVFNYSILAPAEDKAVNRPGFGHIAFEVDDVARARDEVMAHGGHAVGAIVTVTIATGRRVSWCYVTDPEGNAIELQAWD